MTRINLRDGGGVVKQNGRPGAAYQAVPISNVANSLPMGNDVATIRADNAVQSAAVKRETVTKPQISHQPKRGADIQEALSSLSDRTDLERLFDRRVELSQILRLAG